MTIPIDGHEVRKLREARCWTQEDLADASRISLRTVQRIENGAAASRQSCAALAAAFGVDSSALRPGSNPQGRNASERNELRKYLEFRLSFWIHLVTYLFVMGLLFAINLADRANGLWVAWPAIGWGIGVVAHGATVFLVGAIGKTGEKVKALEA